MMKANILGQDYEILYQTEKENPKLETCNGLCECYSKEIIINKDTQETDGTYSNFQAWKDKTLRHEIIHAYFQEMGMMEYCNDETLVDLLAHQIPKMIKTFKELKI